MYIFFWFFKQLYYLFKRFTKHKFLLLLVFFVVAIFLFLKPTFATDTSYPSTYGYYHGFTSEDINFINQEIEQKKGDFDSFVCRAFFRPSTGTNVITLVFYYQSDYPKLYLVPSSNSNEYIIRVYSNTYSNAAKWYAYYYNTKEYVSTGNYSVIDLASNSPNSNTDYFLYTNRAIYTSSSSNDIFFTGANSSLDTPIIETPSSSIIDFSFDNLIINAHSFDINDSYELQFTYPNNSTKITGNIDSYKSIQNNNLIFTIPKSWITQGIVVRTDTIITFDLLQFHRSGNAVTQNRYSLGGYTLDLTTEQETEINEDSNKQLLSDINNNQKETTQAVEHLENTITDSNVEDSSIYLPTDNTNDITQEGLNGIFTSIYNAFCTGEAQDIVFPIPFTNKNITLQANYVSQMLQNSGASWVITIIQAFWWYLISTFIVKDITNKITKIKSGNIEDIENTNIKGDML